MSDGYAHGTQVGRAVCEALGIDPARVCRLVITLDAEDIVRVEVTRIATLEQMQAATLVLEKNRHKVRTIDGTRYTVDGLEYEVREPQGGPGR